MKTGSHWVFCINQKMGEKQQMKHLNKTLRSVLMTALVAALLVGAAVGAVNITKKTVEINYRNIKLVVDGVEVSTASEPFIMDGTTYLPVRAVGEALGKEVNWDGETGTVYIGKVPGTEDNWMTKLPPYQVYNAKVYDGSDRKATFDVAGVTQTSGVTFYEYYGDPFAIWNTNGAYKTMTFTLGHVGDNAKNGTMEVYLDGEYSTEYELKFDVAPKTITIDLKYAPNVKLLFKGTTVSYGIYDISFS